MSINYTDRSQMMGSIVCDGRIIAYQAYHVSWLFAYFSSETWAFSEYWLRPLVMKNVNIYDEHEYVLFARLVFM